MSTLARAYTRTRAASGPREDDAEEQTRRRLYVFDGLRLMAALMVVVFHYVGFNHWSPSPWGDSTTRLFPGLHSVAAYGWLGVQLFFLISGFVICLSCWDRTPRQFAVSRFVRLYPAYWFAVLATSAMFLLRPEGTDITASRILTNLTMFQEPLGVTDIDSVYWSLWAELRFYLLFAAVAALGLGYRRVTAFCGLWLLATLLATATNNSTLQLATVPDAAPFFVGGIVLYLMHRCGPTPALWLLLGASWLVGQHRLVKLVANAEHSVNSPLSWKIALAVVTAFYALMLAGALGRLDRFNWRRLAGAGAMTYPLYLLHEELGWQVIRHAHDRMSPWVLVTALMAVMLLAAWMVHRFIERPVAGRLKAWLDRPKTGIEFDRTP